jgi:excisionase family DNA binding protein
MTEVPHLLTEAEAARKLGIHVNTLRNIRRRGEISCRQVGKRARYTADDLNEYLARGWQTNNDSRSETTSSPNAMDLNNGAGRGSTPVLDKHVAHLLAQRTFGKPSSSSRNG